ncbi:MAG TPA: AraC family transcriptional regulator [Hypericibacter adhaerens]|uniref:AraC family transcriptional regulator n=1 Tax=Hypericibacter adhaerens TaxID=2602016 RepID=A0A5J6N1V9_9PROT|nr:AraC family transcriptional regulator [Hypericibacter adhaerens]QEX20916.1 AraC family transcriptional regulator [Hypericibacter adhaerens]HWA42664.1 AraC family transcriptional regulator [Hypericibacter adhaerens]
MSPATPQRKALSVISVDVISGPPPAIAEIDSHETLVTAPWLHPEIHDDLPELSVHVIGTYYGAPSPRVWRHGRMRLEGVGRPGAFAVVPAHHGGRWDIERPAPLSYVLLSDARLQAFAEQNSARGGRVELLPRIGEPDPVGAHVLRALSRQAAHPDRVAGLFIEQTLDLLCGHLLRVHSSLGRVPPPVPRRGLLPWQVRRVTAYMRDRLDQEIGLNELAGLLGLSRFHFCTAFRLATGQTPHEWLSQRRIERARELLGNPSLRVTDIALTVGYNTHSAFSASFRRATGLTPSDFRRSLKS